jgi:hypothetical protein
MIIHPQRISDDEYVDAIETIEEARTQLEPDGRDCAVCGDDGHQAWECHHNPVVLAKQSWVPGSAKTPHEPYIKPKPAAQPKSLFAEAA